MTAVLNHPPSTAAPDAPLVYEMLTEDEACLYAIMMDESGLDQMEFLVTDERNPDGCWRAWPFQWPHWRTRALKQIDQCGRSIGKSESIIARCIAFPFIHPKGEMVLTAPQGIHLDAITERIESTFDSVRILDEMTLGGRSGVKHRPFVISFINGAHIQGRIPQLNGAGIKGTHPIWLELDEAQDYPEAGWKEIIETVQRGVDGAEWRAHGVPRGIPDKFQEYILSGDWVVNQYTAVHRPNWSLEEREAKIKEYGSSADDPDFKRNVYGDMGDSQNRIFVLSRFMECADSVEVDDYNRNEYFLRKISAEQIESRVKNLGPLSEGTTEEHAAVVMDLLDFPMRHKSQYETFWVGMDVGLVNDPSEILVFAEYQPTTKELKLDAQEGRAVPLNGASRLKLVSRIQLNRVPNPLQVEVVLRVVDFYRPKAFSLDKTGIGLNLLQELQTRALKSRFAVVEDGASIEDPKVVDARKTLTVIKGYGYSEKVVVDIDAALEEALPPGLTIQEIADKAGIKAIVKEHATDKLRELVDDGRLFLPWDKEVINQWNGQTVTNRSGGTDAYGKPMRAYSKGVFHSLDAGRMMAIGYFQAPVEALLLAPAQIKKPGAALFG